MSSSSSSQPPTPHTQGSPTDPFDISVQLDTCKRIFTKAYDHLQRRGVCLNYEAGDLQLHIKRCWSVYKESVRVGQAISSQLMRPGESSVNTARVVAQVVLKQMIYYYIAVLRYRRDREKLTLLYKHALNRFRQLYRRVDEYYPVVLQYSICGSEENRREFHLHFPSATFRKLLAGN